MFCLSPETAKYIENHTARKMRAFENYDGPQNASNTIF